MFFVIASIQLEESRILSSPNASIPAVRAAIETLESRRLLSAVVGGMNFVITGTEPSIFATGNHGDDVITVTLDETTATVNDNGVESTLTVPVGSRLRVFLLGGDDTLNVTLIGRSIPATVYGGSGDDVIDFAALDETLRIYGEGGDDTIDISRSGHTAGQELFTYIYGDTYGQVSSGKDTFIGGNATVDRFFGGAGNDTASGGDGVDILRGDGGDDVLNGNAGDDSLSCADGNDTLDGGSGDDTLIAGNGIDSLYGGDGNDNLSGNDGTDDLIGSAGNDSLVGGAGDDILSGNDGDDVLIGGEGNDKLNGGLDTDLLTGGPDADTFVSTEFRVGEVSDFDGAEDALTGNFGLDGTTLTVDGGNGVDNLALQRGREVLSDFPDPDVLYFNFRSSGASTVMQEFDVNEIREVRVFLGAGDDAADFYDLPETIDVTVYGGSGDDTILHEGSAGTLRFYGEGGNDNIDRYPSRAAPGTRILYGGPGDDFLFGSSTDDYIVGDSGNDTLIGSGGNDRLFGGDGIDSLTGDSGDDTLTGDPGADDLTGGSDHDLFANDDEDRLLDFNPDLDELA